MSIIEHPSLDVARAEWVEVGSPVPLQIAHTDEGTWEVLWHDSLWDGNSGCSTPITEWTTWEEAIAWACWASRHLATVYRLGRDSIVGPMPPTWKECARLSPEVGHEREGYSCSTHNQSWDECPHRKAPISSTEENAS